jgi:hypothetical protein
MPNPLALLPYALGAYGGYKGYQGAKERGASGIGRLLGAAGGAYGGYTLGSAGMSMFPGSDATKAFVASQPQMLANLPGAYNPRQQVVPFTPSSQGRQFIGQEGAIVGDPRTMTNLEKTEGGSLLDIFRKKGSDEYDPLKIALAAGGIPFALGAFDQAPQDIYMPGYNMSYLQLRDKRPGYTYIDPTTGEEKAYEKIYAPEEQGLGDKRMGPYSMNVQRLRTGGIAEIQKFNEGGVNYLPSKVSHDENDANNYVRASGYVEDGSGNGDKDEDTMLAQLADGEFVTRADGVLGAGIIAGANPNSMKDMREKGAKYFYEQQARYKRVFDLLKEKNGDSKQKAN